MKEQSAPWDAFEDPRIGHIVKERQSLLSRLATVEAQAAGLRNTLKQITFDIHSNPDLRHQRCVDLATIALKTNDCGQSLLARLEEARWLLENLAEGNWYKEGWLQRRNAWLSGHTPTITPEPKTPYTTLNNQELRSALIERDDQLRRAMAELEECKKGIKE